MFAVCAIAVLCLMPLSRAAPLDCKDLLKPLGQIDLGHLEGRWALVADSLKIIQGEPSSLTLDSVSVDFYNSTYTQANRYGEQCSYRSQKVSIEGPDFEFRSGQFHLNGTLFHTSCPDCVMLRFNIDSPFLKVMELCLLSRRRQVDRKELEEFGAQVACLNMPQHVEMDPTKEFCPVPSPKSD